MLLHRLYSYASVACLASLEVIGYNMIDPEYLQRYPYCGVTKLPSRDRPPSRVANGMNSKNVYPWAVFLVKTTYFLGNEKPLKTTCTGSVITER